jgi:hypothetical protein
MKPLLLSAIVSTLALSLLAPDTASAKGVRIPKPKPTPVPEKVNASGAKIAKVGGNSITIEESKKSTDYKLTNETHITLDGKPAGAADLRPGMHVEVGASTLNPTMLLTLSATSVSKK